MLESENVDQAENFKYLGIVIDENLTLTNHVDAIIKKTNQRLYLLRKLRSFNVSSHVMSLVYNSIIQIINLSFNIVTLFGHNYQSEGQNKAKSGGQCSQ